MINVMRCLAGVEWGADVVSHTDMYVTLIILRLDYRSIVYRSAATSVLDVIQRVCLKAMRTSPLCPVQVEAEKCSCFFVENNWMSTIGYI